MCNILFLTVLACVIYIIHAIFYLLSVLVCIPPDAGALRISIGDDVACRLINVIICGCRTRNTDQHENTRNTDQHEKPTDVSHENPMLQQF